MTTWLYLEPFLYKKEFLHLTDISRRLNRPHSTVRKYLNFFEKQGILVKNTKGRLTLYKINFSFPLLIDYLVLVEKERLINKCKKDLIINELVSFLHKYLDENNKALIFGSAIINTKKARDIDLLITGKINFAEKIKEFEKKFSVKVHLINIKNLKAINDALREEIMKKHLIIHGSEDIIKWLV